MAEANGYQNQPRRSHKKEKAERKLSITGITSDIRSKYKIHDQEIGHGHYGIVRKCADKDTTEIFAVKTIKKNKVGRIDSLRREVQILQAVDHPNIIKLRDIYEDDKYLHLVMELCEGGELFDRIIAKTQSPEGHYSEKDCAKLVQKILRAINYCHTIHNICHRDLKPENFIFKTKDEDSELKIIDFGLSRYEDVGIEMTTRVGTPYYIAPEVLARKYDKACDLWSIGVITYILICGYPPFYGDKDAEIFESVKKAEFNFPSPEWDGISPQAKAFIRALLQKNPSARMTAQEALQHEWFSLALGDDFESLPIYQSINTSLRRFFGMNNLKKVALNVIAHQMTEADIGNLTDAFAKLDKDGNGVISIDELQEALIHASAQAEDADVQNEVMNLMGAADIDGSNSLDYREFLAATMERRIFLREENIRKAFQYFDLERKGFITMDNLVRIFGSEAHARSILGDVDTNKDGAISFDEFKTMMEDNLSPRKPNPQTFGKSQKMTTDHLAITTDQPSVEYIEEVPPFSTKGTSNGIAESFQQPRSSSLSRVDQRLSEMTPSDIRLQCQQSRSSMPHVRLARGSFTQFSGQSTPIQRHCRSLVGSPSGGGSSSSLFPKLSLSSCQQQGTLPRIHNGSPAMKAEDSTPTRWSECSGRSDRHLPLDGTGGVGSVSLPQMGKPGSSSRR